MMNGPMMPLNTSLAVRQERGLPHRGTGRMAHRGCFSLASACIIHLVERHILQHALCRSAAAEQDDAQTVTVNAMLHADILCCDCASVRAEDRAVRISSWQPRLHSISKVRIWI